MRDSYDVVVIGAGAAGLAAARRLMAAQREVLVLEAAQRVGGRAHVANAAGHPVDLGCGWLHSADKNAWVALGEKLGLTINREPPAWEKQTCDVLFGPDEQRAFRAELNVFFKRVDDAGKVGPDRAASDFLNDGNRWNPLIDAVSAFFNGVEWREVSTIDFNIYEDTEKNWRIEQSLGAAVALYADSVPVMTECPVTCVRWDGAGVCIETPRGVVRAEACVITVSSAVLAQERLRFDPPLPDKHEAASHLPLGAVEKVFLELTEPEMLPAEGHFFGRADSAATGSYHLRPFGRPLIECFFGGALAFDLSRNGAGAFVECAKQELVSLLGSHVAHVLKPAAHSHWLGDPHIGGAYSHAEVGYAPARQTLAAPVAERIYFAGEACSRAAFSTVHGAYESGIAAAEKLLAHRA